MKILPGALAPVTRRAVREIEALRDEVATSIVGGFCQTYEEYKAGAAKIAAFNSAIEVLVSVSNEAMGAHVMQQEEQS